MRWLKICIYAFLSVYLTFDVLSLPRLDDFQSVTHSFFTIYFDPQDAPYAEHAFEILTAAYDEIAFDLELVQTDTFSIYIMPTRKLFRDALRGRLPMWASAYANPMMDRMVVKSPRWNPDDSFEKSLIHELSHLLIHKHVGARELPRWLDEGLAIFYSGEKR